MKLILFCITAQVLYYNFFPIFNEHSFLSLLNIAYFACECCIFLVLKFNKKGKVNPKPFVLCIIVLNPSLKFW